MNTVTIKKNSFDEYEVPAPTTDCIYFTDDKEDAVDTAKLYHEPGSVKIVVRRGSYTNS